MGSGKFWHSKCSKSLEILKHSQTQTTVLSPLPNALAGTNSPRSGKLESDLVMSSAWRISSESKMITPVLLFFLGGGSSAIIRFREKEESSTNSFGNEAILSQWWFSCGLTAWPQTFWFSIFCWGGGQYIYRRLKSVSMLQTRPKFGKSTFASKHAPSPEKSKIQTSVSSPRSQKFAKSENLRKNMCFFVLNSRFSSVSNYLRNWYGN